jgi:hypothetical protein
VCLRRNQKKKKRLFFIYINTHGTSETI